MIDWARLALWGGGMLAVVYGLWKRHQQIVLWRDRERDLQELVRTLTSRKKTSGNYPGSGDGDA
jgi:hypothetical protein